MKKTPLAFFVGGAVTCAILLAIVTRDRWQGQPSAVQTATSGQSAETASSTTTEVQTATDQTGTEQSVATTDNSSEGSEQEATPSVAESAKEAEQVAAVEPKAEPVAEPKPETATKAVEPAQPANTESTAIEPASTMVKPTFDLITVAPDGLATISGRAEPGAQIAVMLDEEVLGNALTNETKTWHLAPEPFLPSGDHNLTATATMPDGEVLQFEQSVTVAIDAKAEKQPLIVLSEPSAPSKVLQKPEPEQTAETEAEPAVNQEVAAVDTTSREPATIPETTTEPTVKVDPEPKAETTPEPAIEPAPKAETQATADPEPTPEPVAKAEPEAVAETVAKAEVEPVVEPAPKTDKKAEPQPVVETRKAPLILDTVDYNDTGNIIFSGKSDPGGKVRIYVDGQHVGDALADASGSWVFKGNENIVPGLHSLRIDQVRSDGTVVQRRELPFERAEPLKVAELQSAQNSKPAAEKSKPADETQTAAVTEQTEAVKADPAVPKNGRVVIQPGNNLWNISRVIYGRGIEYTAIYEANKDQIRDPHRIYPGQIFMTPGTVSPEEIDPDRREPFSMEEKQTQ